MTATPNMPITSTPDKPATTTPVLPATPTPEAFDSQNCAWMWATQALPQLSASIQQAVDAKGLLTVQISASAFGENCINSQTNQVRGFATTETDFNVRMTLTDPQDISLAGNELAGLLDVLADLPPESTPGP